MIQSILNYLTIIIIASSLWGVAVVRQNGLHGISVLFTAFFEQLDGGFRERGGAPLTLVFGKERKPGGSDFVGAHRGLFDASCCTDVSSNVFHSLVCVGFGGGKVVGVMRVLN